MTEFKTPSDLEPKLSVSESLELFKTALRKAGWHPITPGRYGRSIYLLSIGYGCGEATVRVRYTHASEPFVTYQGIDPLSALIKYPYVKGLKELAIACKEQLDKHNAKP